MKFLFFGILVVSLNSCNDSSTNKSGGADTSNLEFKAYNSLKSRNYSKAIAYYDTLIQIDSLNGQHYFGRASAYGHMGQMNEAIENYFKSIELKYRISASYYGLGLLNTYVNDSSAVIYFKKSLETYTESEVLLKRKDIREEIDDCLERLKNDPFK